MYIGLTSPAPLNELESQASTYYNNRLEVRFKLYIKIVWSTKFKLF